MSCTSTPTAMTELEFVQTLATRSVGQCAGPGLTLALQSYRVITLETIFHSDLATALLWDGYRCEGRTGTHFDLCAAHWLDLCALTWMRSQQYRKRDWHAEADQLLRDLCEQAGWDPKEIVNMFSWQRTQLT